jgi:hypothetical protein
VLCTVIRAMYLNGTNNIPTKAFLATYLLDFSLIMRKCLIFFIEIRNYYVNVNSNDNSDT